MLLHVLPGFLTGSIIVYECPLLHILYGAMMRHICPMAKEYAASYLMTGHSPNDIHVSVWARLNLFTVASILLAMLQYIQVYLFASTGKLLHLASRRQSRLRTWVLPLYRCFDHFMALS